MSQVTTILTSTEPVRMLLNQYPNGDVLCYTSSKTVGKTTWHLEWNQICQGTVDCTLTF